MQIQMRVVVAIGAAYFIGYSRGMAASENLGSQISEGLNKIGDGLRDIAVEVGVDYKKSQEDKKQFDENVVNNKTLNVEEKIVRMGRRRDLYRSNEQIADRLQTTVEDVTAILAEDGPPDIEGEETSGPLISGRVAEPSEEAVESYVRDHGIDDRGKQEIVGPSKVAYSGMSARSQGEPPDQPGSDAS